MCEDENTEAVERSQRQIRDESGTVQEKVEDEVGHKEKRARGNESRRGEWRAAYPQLRQNAASSASHVLA